jgi:5-formyltetrahydrofolate cyclo-ligase
VELDLPGRELIVARAKRALRSRFRALRQAIPAESRAARSARIVEGLLGLEVMGRARAVALFHPIDSRGEVDLRALDENLRSRGVEVYYPSVDDEGAPVFRRARPEELVSQGRGFLEPPRGAPVPRAGGLDLVVVPALAADASGHRLGYGAGFYDRALADLGEDVVRIVVAFDFQVLGEVPTLEHDVAAHWVVSDERVLEITAAGAP